MSQDTQKNIFSEEEWKTIGEDCLVDMMMTEDTLLLFRNFLSFIMEWNQESCGFATPIASLFIKGFSNISKKQKVSFVQQHVGNSMLPDDPIRGTSILLDKFTSHIDEQRQYAIICYLEGNGEDDPDEWCLSLLPATCLRELRTSLMDSLKGCLPQNMEKSISSSMLVHYSKLLKALISQNKKRKQQQADEQKEEQTNKKVS